MKTELVTLIRNILLIKILLRFVKLAQKSHNVIKSFMVFHIVQIVRLTYPLYKVQYNTTNIYNLHYTNVAKEYARYVNYDVYDTITIEIIKFATYNYSEL